MGLPPRVNFWRNNSGCFVARLWRLVEFFITKSSVRHRNVEKTADRHLEVAIRLLIDSLTNCISERFLDHSLMGCIRHFSILVMVLATIS
jgi:hypothetical protein